MIWIYQWSILTFIFTGIAVIGRVIPYQSLSIKIARVSCAHGCCQQDKLWKFPNSSVVICWEPMGNLTTSTSWCHLSFTIFNTSSSIVMLLQAQGLWRSWNCGPIFLQNFSTPTLPHPSLLLMNEILDSESWQVINFWRREIFPSPTSGNSFEIGYSGQ